ncbi:MAG: hypothetical protein ACR2M0_02340 [Chloroflexia bacterium]
MSRIVMFVLLALLVSGCGGTAPPATAVIPPTSAPDTAAPPALTPTSAAGNTQGSSSLTANDVLAAFKAAGLPIGEVTDFPPQPARTPPPDVPGQYITKVTWHDTRLPTPAHPILIEVSDGGGVEVYADNDTAQTHADNIQSNQQLFSSAAETDTVQGNLLLRLAAGLTPDAVAAYQRVLANLP